MRWKRKIHHGGPSKQQQVSPLADEVCAIDEEVSHLCRIKSEPSQRTRASIYAGQKRPVSTFKLLSGRESNCSGMGRFSSADCSYALRKHLPVKGPWCVDDMDSEAYISQFSADGSLLIGGFRVCDSAIMGNNLTINCIVFFHITWIGSLLSCWWLNSTCLNIFREATSESITPKKIGRFIKI